MNILGIIPARFASTRFPGKPLIDIAGTSMIQRVYQQCAKSELLGGLLVATDDTRIRDHVLNFTKNVMITSSKHGSGTDRCAEVARKNPHYDVYINIQGDEPFIDPAQIDLVCTCFEQAAHQIATLIKKIRTVEELINENIPKVIINRDGQALYFSRATIPFCRGKETASWLNQQIYYKHIGIYGYRKAALLAIAELPISPLEKTEALEQLRWLEHGYHIQTAITELETQAIDSPEDLQKILKRMK